MWSQLSEDQVLEFLTKLNDTLRFEFEELEKILREGFDTLSNQNKKIIDMLTNK